MAVDVAAPQPPPTSTVAASSAQTHFMPAPPQPPAFLAPDVIQQAQSYGVDVNAAASRMNVQRGIVNGIIHDARSAFCTRS